MPKRYCRGAAELFFVMALVAVVGGGLLIYYMDKQAAALAAHDHHAGRLAAAWFLAAHRAGQENDLTARIAGGGGSLITPVELRQLGAPLQGLRAAAANGAGIVMGHIDDGSGVAMAFVVAEPENAAAIAAMRQGALAMGLAGFDEAANPASPMAANIPAIEAVLGRSLAPNAIFATADRGILYREDALYRRAQPGNPQLTRMEANLDLTAQSLAGAGGVTAQSAALTGDAAVGQNSIISGTVSSARLQGSALRAEHLEVAGPMAVTGDPFEAGALDTTEIGSPIFLSADTLIAPVQHYNRSEAWEITTRSLSMTGTMYSNRLDVLSQDIEVTNELSADTIETRGLYGPSATITNRLTTTECPRC